MSDRRQWDQPATMILLVAGLLVVGGSVPFAFLEYCKQEGGAWCPVDQTGEKSWDVTWGRLESGTDQASIAASGATDQALVPVSDLLVEEVVASLAPGGCDDTHNTQLGQGPASFQFTVVRKVAGSDDVLHTGNFTCAQARVQGVTVRLNATTHPILFPGHPDVATVNAITAEEARAKVWAGNPSNDTAEYILTLSATRPPDTLPVSIPGTETSLRATMTLRVHHAGMAVNERDPEVLR